MNTHTKTETALNGQNVEQICIDTRYKLELVAAKPNQCRPNIENIRIDHNPRFGNVAVATQGRSMAIVPITVDREPDDKTPVTPSLVSVEALKASRKVKHVAGNMTLNGDIKLPDGKSFPLPEANIPYPLWEQALPEKGSKITFTVALNAQLLLDLAKALGTDGKVTLRFIDELSPITVTPNYKGNGEHGVLMPMRIGG